MTRIKIRAAAAAISFPVLIAAGATFRNPNYYDPPQSSIAIDFDDRPISTRKGDRLPLTTSPPIPMRAEPVVAPSVAYAPEQLPLATEDDLRQAEAEHQRHRDICPRGRTYFTVEHHQYWRCKR
jgi:hypothetical protein